jgi:hypothetical protein
MTRAQCLKLARYAARQAGFASARALHAHVIHKGYQPGSDLRAFTLAQALHHHVVQPLVWAAEDAGVERARWVRVAYRGAFLAWLTGQAA